MIAMAEKIAKVDFDSRSGCRFRAITVKDCFLVAGFCRGAAISVVKIASEMVTGNCLRVSWLWWLDLFASDLMPFFYLDLDL